MLVRIAGIAVRLGPLVDFLGPSCEALDHVRWSAMLVGMTEHKTWTVTDAERVRRELRALLDREIPVGRSGEPLCEPACTCVACVAYVDRVQ